MVKPNRHFSVEKAIRDMEADNAARKPGEIIWSMFRCADLNCNKLLTVEAHDEGMCDDCQGIRFMIARYLTPKESKLIKAGKLRPHKVNLDEIGPEPPQEVR